jgi:hypothetical protein
MKYEYGGWVIDATPDFSLGQFFAHARIIRSSPDDDVDTEMHVERNLAWFETEDEAIEAARRWAIEWIDARDDNLVIPAIETLNRQNNLSAKAPAR